MQFRIKALRHPGAIVETMLEAPSREAAMQMASDQGMRVISIAAPRARLQLLGGRAQPFPLLLFSQQLATLLRAGLSLIDCLESLTDKQDRAGHRKVLEGVARALREGKPFSQALGEAPETFPDLFVALVRASERTGEVGSMLMRYASYRTQSDQLRSRIVSASIYPAVLVVMGTAVMLFLLGFVVPKFARVYEDVGHNLPWLSQVLLAWGRFVAAHIAALGIAVVAAIAIGVGAWRAHGSGERVWLALEGLPGIRERVFLFQLGRFYRSLGMLLRGGIPIIPAIAMVQGLVKGSLRPRLAQVAPRVSEGLALSRALEENGLATRVALKMLRAGERSGNLGEMLERAADFHDEELARWIDWFVKLFEPLLMAAIGVLIGVIVVLMYMPIFELASSIE